MLNKICRSTVNERLPSKPHPETLSEISDTIHIFKQLLHVLEPKYEPCDIGHTTCMNRKLMKYNKVG